jgi:hypothetical protein
VAAVQRLGDREVEHRVAEELQPFVVAHGLARVLMQPG